MIRIVKKADVRRSEIVAVARDLFQTKGYAHTAMQDVMEQLGIAKGTIYHYFKSKEELLQAVAEATVDEHIEDMRQLLSRIQGTPLEKLRALILAGRMADEHADLLEHLHQADNVGMHTRLMALTVARQAPLYAELVRQGCQAGQFQTDAPLECAEFILAATQFLTDMGIYPWTPEDLLRRAQALPGLIEAQLKAAPGSFSFLLESM